MPQETTTPNLSLPLMQAGQADKHVTHNTALIELDRVVQARAKGRASSPQGTSPVAGETWLISDQPTGGWTGHASHLAVWDSSAWRFVQPAAGFLIWVDADQAYAFWNGALWMQLGEQQAMLGVNAVPTATNRFSVASPASLFNHSGSGHQLKINKAGVGETASILLQNGYSGRAEVGIAGNDSLSIKVSPDGTNWKTALSVDPSSGRVVMPQSTPAAVFCSSASQITTSSVTPVATGVAVTITPSRANAQFKITGHASVGADYWHTLPQVSIYRDGQKLWPPGSGFLQHQLIADNAVNSAFNSMNYSIGLIDQISGSGPVTYEIRLSSRTEGYNAYLNRRHLDDSFLGDTLLMVEELPG